MTDDDNGDVGLHHNLMNDGGVMTTTTTRMMMMMTMKTYMWMPFILFVFIVVLDPNVGSRRR
jgi:S-adenosylmethionine hydrolase